MAEPDRDRQQQARSYAVLRRRVFIAELLLGGGYLLGITLLGVATDVRSSLASRALAQPLQVAAMFLLLCVSYGVVAAPLTYYSGFQLPHRFGLVTQSMRSWLWDWAKGALVSMAFGLLAVEVIYYLLAAFPQVWWLLAALAMLLFTVVLSNLAPILLLPLFYKLSPLVDAELAQRLAGLAERSGARVKGVYSVNMSSKTTAANAALMGLGNTRRIVLGDTLLERYDADEIETVLAHELGHHVHGDIPKGIALQTILTLVSFLVAHVVLGWAIAFFGYGGLSDVAGMPLLGLVLGAFALLAMPLSNSFSRHIETNADRYALATTAKPAAFARAMIKLSDQNLAEFSPPGWVEWILYDHPSAQRRVRMAGQYREDADRRE